MTVTAPTLDFAPGVARPAQRRLRVGHWVFIMPLLAALGVMLVYPTVWLVALATTKSTLGKPFQSWLGADQIVAAVTDGDVQAALLRAVLFAFPVAFTQVALGFGIALVADRLYRGSRPFVVLILLPLLTPPVMVAVAWKLILAPSGGLVNGALLSLGLIDQPISFFGSATLAWLSIGVADTWQWTPFVALLTFAAMRSIPEDLLDAARLDGARLWAQVRYIILPLIGPTLAGLLLLRVIVALKLFDLVYVLTFGGPGDATTVPAFQIWRAGLQEFDVGRAAAETLVFAAVAGFVTLPAVWLARRADQGDGA